MEVRDKGDIAEGHAECNGQGLRTDRGSSWSPEEGGKFKKGFRAPKTRVGRRLRNTQDEEMRDTGKAAYTK